MELIFVHPLRPPIQGDPSAILYGTLSCSDNVNNGMRRIINTIKQSAFSTFYGDIGFDKIGSNYQAVAAVVQVIGFIGRMNNERIGE